MHVLLVQVDGSINLAAAIKGFLPSIDLTGIPGISGLQLPEFSLAIRKPRLPGLPAFPKLPDFSLRLPNVRPRLPRLKLPSLQLPGVNFAALFRPLKVGLPDLLSIGGGLGLGPLCFNFKDGEDGPPAPLSAITEVVFPALSIGSLPEPFGALLDVQVRELCLNRSAKTFTADVLFPTPIEVVPSKPGLMTIPTMMVRVVVNAARRPIKFDFTASAEVTFGGIDLEFFFQKTQNGNYVFIARQPAGTSLAASQLPTLFGAPEVTEVLDTLQLSPLTLSNFQFTISRQPMVMIHVTATVSYRQLPSVTLELVLSKPFTTSASMAAGIRTSSATLADIVSSIVPDVDISDVPVVGDVTVPSTAAIYVNASLPATLNIPFSTPDLAVLGRSQLKTKLSLLFPVTFPRVGRKNFVAAFNRINIDFEVRNVA